MTKSPSYWNKARKYLSKKDKVMKDLIIKYRDKTLTTRKDIFFSLCKSIIRQQISVAAATLICWPIILLHKEKKISFLDVKMVSVGLR